MTNPTESQMRAVAKGILRAEARGEKVTHVRVARHGFKTPALVPLALEVLRRMQDMGYTDCRDGEWYLHPQGLDLAK